MSWLMKAFVLLLCGLTVAASSPTEIYEWEEFKSVFGKSYETSGEENDRESIFDNNLRLVNEHNERFKMGLETFNLAINEYGDMTSEEFAKKKLGLATPKAPHSITTLFVSDPEEAAAETVDWRDKGAVTQVKNQEDCGSCWAFSATGSLEGQHFLKTGKLVSLSEQNLVDCSKEFGNNGCWGGFPDNAFKYIKHNNGIDTEESYPYKSMDGKCKFERANVGATMTGYVDIAHGNETALLNAVSKIGPVSVGIDASEQKFHLYHSGIYYNPNCSSIHLDHGVLAVGYGEEDGEAYWLVKNSWGAAWGDNGYIKMSRNKDNNCGIATQASYPLV